MHDNRAARWRGRRVRRAGIGLAVVAAIAGAIAVSAVPLGRVGGTLPASSSAYVPIGSPVGGSEVGLALPELVAADGRTALLVDLDGRPIHLADFAGRPLWIVFWATWCTPCQQEAPAIRAAYHAHAVDDLAVLAIDLQEPAAAVRDYASANQLDYVIGLDPSAAVKDLYRAAGLPWHLFLDGRGVVRARYAGELTSDLMEQYLSVIIGD